MLADCDRMFIARKRTSIARITAQHVSSRRCFSRRKLSSKHWRTGIAVDQSQPFALWVTGPFFPSSEIRPTAILLMTASSVLAPVGQQVHRDVPQDRPGVKARERVVPCNLDDTEAFQAGNAQPLLPDFAQTFRLERRRPRRGTWIVQYGGPPGFLIIDVKAHRCAFASRRAVSSALACLAVGNLQSAHRRPAIDHSRLTIEQIENKMIRRQRGEMSESAKKDEQPPDPAAELDTAVEHAIEACDGDLLATIRAMIVANTMLETELADVNAKASRGFLRGRRVKSRSSNETPKGQ